MAIFCFNPCSLARDSIRGLFILAGVLVFSIWSLFALYLPREASATAKQEGGKDLQAYRAIVVRVHHGEDYYSAAGDELRAGGYASSSVFNWRLPTYAWLLAALPTPEWGQVLLGLLALAALALAYNADIREGNRLRSLLLVVLIAGAFLWCIDGDAFFSQELWAGVLIAVSVGAFAVGQRGCGIAAGLVALAIRELAILYVLITLAIACREKRWREASAWCAGLVGFAIFLSWHAWQVSHHLTGSELVEAEGWIQFGGPAFVIQTSQMNVWLFRLPGWVAVLFLAISLLGMARRSGSEKTGVGATAAIYLLAFLVVGKPFNNYWGLLYVGLLPFGFVRFPQSLKTLFVGYDNLKRSVPPLEVTSCLSSCRAMPLHAKSKMS